MTTQYDALGIIAPSGTRYFRIVTEFGGPVLPASDFHIANSRLPADLARYGITLSNKKDLEALLQTVSAVTDFQPADVAEHPGWNGNWFAQQNGVPIGADLGPSHVAFSPSPTVVPASGTLQGWIDGVARPARRHPIAAFAIMTSFLAPVLRFIPKVGNPTFELVGGADTGKSTVQKLAASVAFSPEGLVSLTQVQRDLEAVRQAGRDHPVIIDHTAAPLLTANKPKKAEIFAAVAHNLPRAPGGRVTLISGRCALRDACAIAPVDDSILTLILPDTGTGVFAKLPKGCSSHGDLAHSLLASATAHHGQAFPAFITALCADMAKGPDSCDAIKLSLEKSMAFFVSTAERKGYDISAHRAMRVFGGIYAAGKLAVRYKVLPPRFRSLNAALTALDLHLANEHAHAPFLERLEAMAASGQFLGVDSAVNQATQIAAAQQALGTLTTKSDCRVIKIRSANIRKAFPDWERIKGLDEVRAQLKNDGKNLAAWGQLAPRMTKERLFQFTLPLAPQESLFGPPIDEGQADD